MRDGPMLDFGGKKNMFLQNTRVLKSGSVLIRLLRPLTASETPRTKWGPNPCPAR